MKKVHYNHNTTPEGIFQIIDIINSGGNRAIFATWMDGSWKTSLLQDIEKKLSWSQYIKIPLYYQKQIAIDFGVDLENKYLLQEMQQNIMLERYKEHIRSDLGANTMLPLYDRGLLDLITPRIMSTWKKLEDFEQYIIDFFSMYQNILYIITRSNSDTLVSRIKWRESISDSDIKLLHDIEHNGWKWLYTKLSNENMLFAKYIHKLVSEWKIHWSIIFVDTSDEK